MFSTQTHENAIFPHKVRGEKVWEPKGELIRLSDVIFQDQPMTRLILSSSTKKHFIDSQPRKISKSKSIIFWQNLHSVNVKPSVTHAEAAWPVLDFWCYSLQTKTTNIEFVQLTS